MTTLSPGDSIVCKIKGDCIVNVYEDADYTSIFDVISKYNKGYIIYIPTDMYVKSLIQLTGQNYTNYNAPKKFVGSYVVFITDHHILKVYNRIDGMMCHECSSFSTMAAANQEDGTFRCWNCINYPFYG